MPTSRSLTVKGWFSTGWDTYRDHFGLLVLGTLLKELPLLPLIILFYLTKKPVYMIGLIIYGLAVGVVLSVGWHYLCLQAVRGEKPGLGVLFSAFKRYLQSWLTAIYYFLAVLGGLILVVVPGLLMAVEYAFCVFAVMDKKTPPRESFRYSAKITAGFRNTVFVGWLVYILLNITTQPMMSALQHMDKPWGPVLLVPGIFFYLINLFIISPWVGAFFAAAYDSLAHTYDAGQTQAFKPDIA